MHHNSPRIMLHNKLPCVYRLSKMSPLLEAIIKFSTRNPFLIANSLAKFQFLQLGHDIKLVFQKLKIWFFVNRNWIMKSFLKKIVRTIMSSENSRCHG